MSAATAVKPATVEAAMLQPTDTCDRCGPAVAANVAVRLKTGVLTFCNHHYGQFEVALLPVTLDVQRNPAP